MAKSSVVVRQPFVYDADLVSQETGLLCLDESLTDQSGKDDADINTLVKRFGVTGSIPILDRIPIAADFVAATDYHTAMNALIEADKTFMELPADMRAKFDHDPGKFVEFCTDDKNRDELIKMGLVEAPPEPGAPVLVQIAPGKEEPKV